MTLLFNDPERFSDEALEGFVLANERYVRAVPGGVVRATPGPAGQVAIVVGGGSGHYPAFAGWVGPGFAHGAVSGSVFASPSAGQIHSVARAAESGGGVILGFGNYAGDVLNFDAAAAKLRGDGIAVGLLPVTDDVASAPPVERERRRGIAGDLVVLKILAAAAETGRPLEEVLALGHRANDRTRTLGVAFGGCTLPGGREPLFTVPVGTMALGLGIHGERGLSETPVASADDTARILVDRLLAEVPEGAGSRVVAIVNGLGAVKYEELFVLYRAVRANLAAAGLEPVEPEVGEFVTSFDMPGVSLTLTWLDDDLERLWRAPADTPAYRKGAVAASASPPAEPRRFVPAPELSSEGSLPSQACARRITQAFQAILAALESHEDELGRLDAVAGDGDHGIGMTRGCRAAVGAAAKAEAAGAGAGTVLMRAGEAWAARAGGTSGALWGAALATLGESIGDDEVPELGELASGVRWSVSEIQRIGGAALRDKTMVDAAFPFSEALQLAVDRGDDLGAAWHAAVAAADAGAQATAGYAAAIGRARTHGESSIGSPDPGAISFVHVVRAAGSALAGGRHTT